MYARKQILFMTPYKGIFRARDQQGPAALSINTSTRSPYRDRATADGWIYSYRAGDIDQPDNRASAPRTSSRRRSSTSTRPRPGTTNLSSRGSWTRTIPSSARCMSRRDR